MNNKQKPQTFDFDHIKDVPKEVLLKNCKRALADFPKLKHKNVSLNTGPMKLPKQKRTLVIQFILKFFHPLIILLVVIAAVTFWTGMLSAVLL